jgi:hypothetical protein
MSFNQLFITKKYGWVSKVSWHSNVASNNTQTWNVHDNFV